MQHVSFLLLAVFLLAVAAQDPASRTYGSHHHSHSHARPVSQRPHVGHVHHPHTHGHQLAPLHPDVLQSLLQAHAHQHSSVPAQAASNVNTVPVMVCRIIQVPVAQPLSSVVPKGDAISGPPQHVFQNIPSSIGNVVSRVMNPVVTLLHNASVWFNRTSHREQSHSAHHQHNFTVINSTVHHGHSHHAHHHQNFTAPKADIIDKKLPTPEKLSHQQTRRCSRITSRPAVATEVTTTPSPAPVPTSTVPATEMTTRASSSATVTMPVLKSRLCSYGPTSSAPVPRAYPFPVVGAVATSIDVPTAIPEERTLEIHEAITTAANTVPPTTLTAVSPSLPEDRAQGTASTLAATPLLVQSTTQPTPVPTRNEPVASTYSPASDTASP
ncbi:hypothetical protein HPB49_020252 [Dermacentor silvarum]|uniref:Uncharacterized protein n=1 Tax=Dermacentor silvarum TaxID=543639 RepID=A0ACB8CZI6_DERSI|nr:hypothetical protein HPB49_020252 [Dermacentor silvarum]